MAREGKRREGNSRERRDRAAKIVGRWVWHTSAEKVGIRAKLDGRGKLTVKLHDPERIDGADRERAAAWLREILPVLDHETAYSMLWD